MSTVKIHHQRVRISYCCPKCNGKLSRISKRGIDKVLNAIVPVKRFRCEGCVWEGNRYFTAG